MVGGRSLICQISPLPGVTCPRLYAGSTSNNLLGRSPESGLNAKLVRCTPDHGPAGGPEEPWSDVVDLRPHPPHHPGMDRWLAASLARPEGNVTGLSPSWATRSSGSGWNSSRPRFLSSPGPWPDDPALAAGAGG
jgi:hypothetical protein